MEYIVGAIVEYLFFRLGRWCLRIITVGRVNGDNPHHFYLISLFGFLITCLLLLIIVLVVSL
ncbi:hypothetical protein D3C76_188460 [compost metagenome]